MSLLQGGDGMHQVLLRDVVDAIRGAATDRASRRWSSRPTAFPVPAWPSSRRSPRRSTFPPDGQEGAPGASHFDQAQYHLAAHADEVFLNPDGYVLLTGFGRYPTYFKGLFDQVGVKMQVFRVGTYKSFVEPYTRSDMSPEDREATRSTSTPRGRPIRPTSPRPARRPAPGLARYVGERPPCWPPPVAMRRDGPRRRLRGWPQERRRMARLRRGLFGPPTTARASSTWIWPPTSAACARRRPIRPQGRRGGGPGGHRRRRAAAGVVGGDTVAGLIRQAREDDAVKAGAARRQPGGSATASEVIRRELELTRKAGKPGGLDGFGGGLGGYWISMAADECGPARPPSPARSASSRCCRISGPIGKLGLAVDGVGTTPLAGGLDPRRPSTRRSPACSSRASSTATSASWAWWARPAR
jgi:protease-4